MRCHRPGFESCRPEEPDAERGASGFEWVRPRRPADLVPANAEERPGLAAAGKRVLKDLTLQGLKMSSLRHTTWFLYTF